MSGKYFQTISNPPWIATFILVMFVALTLWAGPALAEKAQTPTGPINMDQAIAMALDYSPNLTTPNSAKRYWLLRRKPVNTGWLRPVDHL